MDHLHLYVLSALIIGCHSWASEAPWALRHPLHSPCHCCWSYPLLWQAFLLLNGGHIGFFRGDPKLLIEDVKALQPTLFVGVPRLFTKIYDKVSCLLVWSWYELSRGFIVHPSLAYLFSHSILWGYFCSLTLQLVWYVLCQLNVKIAAEAVACTVLNWYRRTLYRWIFCDVYVRVRIAGWLYVCM